MEKETLEQYFHRFSHDINCLNDQVISKKHNIINIKIG